MPGCVLLAMLLVDLSSTAERGRVAGATAPGPAAILGARKKLKLFYSVIFCNDIKAMT